MVRRFFSTLIVFSFLFSLVCFAQIEEGYSGENLKAKRTRKALKIKSVNEWGFNYRFGEPDKSGKIIRRSEYDQNGNENSISLFDTVGIIFNKIIFKYNSDDLPVEKQFQFANRIISKITNIYNENGLNSVSNYYEFDGNLNHIAKFKYDSTGNQKEIIIILPNFEVDAKHIFKYDRKNRKTCLIEYSPDGNAMLKYEYKYDPENNLIEQLCFDRFGERIEKILYEYDSNGNRIRINWYDTNNIKTLYCLFKYDEKNILQESISYNGMNEPEYNVKYVYEYY